MNLFFDKKPVAHFDELLDGYDAKEFRSPTRSTVPLLSLVRHGADLWREVIDRLGGDADAADLHLEYRVEPPNGRGIPSHTDAMLLQADRAIAIEAKWTEGPYATVEKWLSGGKRYDDGIAIADDSNRRAVLQGWLSLLQRRASHPLHGDQFSNATYQMVHRAASACASGRAPGLAYIQFAAPGIDVRGRIESLKKNLGHLHRLLGDPAGFPCHLVEIEMHPTAAFERIRTLEKGIAETAEVVKGALRSEPLFEFTKYRLHHFPEDAA
jgi:hypothetical protein